MSNDYWPNWIGTGCVNNLPGSTRCNNAVTPIAVAGIDNAVVATATTWSQCNGQISLTNTVVPNNCALYDYPATLFTPQSIADQLVARHKRWKTYQESLPIVEPGVFGVNYSDGAYSNLSPVADFGPGPIQNELDERDELSLEQVKDFDGPDGLWVDLQSDAPNFSLIVPNQCHDMHGFVSGGTPNCSTSTAAEARLLMAQGDWEVAKLVTGIKASRAWEHGRNAIVLVWDENDLFRCA